MENIKILFTLIAVTALSIMPNKKRDDSKYVTDTITQVEYIELDTVASQIDSLKRINSRDLDEVLQETTKVEIRHVKVTPKRETVFLRIDGNVYEVTLNRDSKIEKFIINIDSLKPILTHDK